MSIKLFDPSVFSEGRPFLLMDSDVLFLREPVKVVKALQGRPDAPPLHSVDTSGPNYCADVGLLRDLTGKKCLETLCAGILVHSNEHIKFSRIEEHLGHPCFLSQIENNKYSWFVEQTLHAIEHTLSDSRPLSDGYDICPDPSSSEVVAGHYCGGNRSSCLYYTHAVPHFLNAIRSR